MFLFNKWYLQKPTAIINLTGETVEAFPFKGGRENDNHYHHK